MPNSGHPRVHPPQARVTNQGNAQNPIKMDHEKRDHHVEFFLGYQKGGVSLNISLLCTHSSVIDSNDDDGHNDDDN